jgi:hypothetical protein
MNSQTVAGEESFRSPDDGTQTQKAASATSQDETLIGGSFNRTDEVAKAERQIVDERDGGRKPLGGLKLFILVSVVSLTGVVVLMDMTVLVTVWLVFFLSCKPMC